jgi:hypothetical protein
MAITHICGRCTHFGGAIGTDGPCKRKQGAIVNWAACCERGFDAKTPGIRPKGNHPLGVEIQRVIAKNIL